MDTLSKTVLAVPVFYDAANEFENDNVLHPTANAARKINIDSIVTGTQKKTMKELSSLFWTVTDGIPDVDMTRWDISRIGGSEGYCFSENKNNRQMHPYLANDNGNIHFLCFTDIIRLKQFCTRQNIRNIHIALFTLGDIAGIAKVDPRMTGFIINLDSDCHCYISKEIFGLK